MYFFNFECYKLYKCQFFWFASFIGILTIKNFPPPFYKTVLKCIYTFLFCFTEIFVFPEKALFNVEPCLKYFNWYHVNHKHKQGLSGLSLDLSESKLAQSSCFSTAASVHPHLLLEAREHWRSDVHYKLCDTFNHQYAYLFHKLLFMSRSLTVR